MALYQSDILTHNNPNLAVADGDFVKGGFRSAVASVNDLYALSGKTDEPSAAGQLKEYATIVYVTGETKYYVLKDITNVDNPAGWEEFSAGSGTITGGTNGLSTDGANIVLGGSLLSGTTINASGNTFYLTNVDEFQVSTSGSTGIIGVDNTGILLEFSGTSVSLENNAGLVYNADYRTTFIDNSLVSKKYVDTVAIGLQPKTAVWVATSTGNTGIDLTGGTFGGTIDGITIADKDRVLIKNQNGSVQDIKNGIYVYSGSSNTFYRSPDFDGTPTGEVSRGALVPVLTGATNRNTLWVLITDEPIVDTTPLSFTPFSTPGNYTEGVGIDIDITGSVISVDGSALAGDHINWDGSSFNVIPSGITSGYTTLSQFNTYTGDTEIRLTTIEDDIIYISGITDTKLDIDIFTGYTASTETRLTGIEDDIDYLSGVTENKLDTSVYTGYTATTEVRLTDIENDIDYISGQTLTISIFTGYTAITETRLTDIENDIQYISGITDNKLDTSIFAAYTGTTQPILNAALTGATNGLTATGRVVKLGGTLSEETTLNLSNNALYVNGGYSNLTMYDCIHTDPMLPGYNQMYYWGVSGSSYIMSELYENYLCTRVGVRYLLSPYYEKSITFNYTGDSVVKDTVFNKGLVYAGDYESNFTARSLVTKQFVEDTITGNSNVLNIVDFTGTGYTATTESDFIGASGGTTIYLPNPPKDGQRIVVADIAGNALSFPITIDGNGNDILNTSTATINTDYGSITFIFNTKGFWSTAAFIN